jgi:hypothetical protein
MLLIFHSVIIRQTIPYYSRLLQVLYYIHNTNIKPISISVRTVSKVNNN